MELLSDAYSKPTFMRLLVFIGVIVAVMAGVAISRGRRTGYRGALGFINRGSVDVDMVTVFGFAKPVTGNTLAPGEHSFNFLGPLPIPSEVIITWRFLGESEDRSARVSLDAVPKDAADGELFFVLSRAGNWTPEYAPALDVERLQRPAG